MKYTLFKASRVWMEREADFWIGLGAHLEEELLLQEENTKFHIVVY